MNRSTLVVVTSVVGILVAALALEPVFGIGRSSYVAGLAATFAGVLGGVPLRFSLIGCGRIKKRGPGPPRMPTRQLMHVERKSNECSTFSGSSDMS
jgi:hypothetical protein